MIALKGHYSPETAYVVADYPYGFRLRCKIRYWLEVHPKKGTRLWTQTTNPKVAGEVWNKAKASTFTMVGVMVVKGEESPEEERGHVTWTGCSPYEASKVEAFLADFRDALLPEQVRFCDALVKVLAAREAKRAAVEQVQS